MKLFIICSFLSITYALSKNEIENIRKELNDELTQLENSGTDKRSNNNQIASVVHDDGEKTDNILRQMGLEMGKKEGTSNLWEEMTKAREKSKDEQNSKRSTKRFQDKTELDKIFENSKKSVDKQANSLDALSKLLMKDESKIRKREYLGRYIPPEECNDQRTDCANFVDYCQEPSYRLMMRERCPETCKACSKCDKKDVWSEKICNNIVKHKLCHTKVFGERIKQNCFQSCGYCKAMSPPACNFDPMGCCWDGETFVKDGCNPCEDSADVKRLCGKLVDECQNEYAPGKWMKKHCPVTCGMCDPTKECHDNKRFIKQCIHWAASGDCSEESTRALCPRTCKTCPNQKSQ